MLLEVDNLHVAYGQIKALQGISFRIDEGEIITIIGANGAGKRTTLRAISRMVPVGAETRMTFRGQDLLRFPPDRVVSRLGISHVPEGRRLFGNLTVMENLLLACFARRDRDRIVDSCLRTPFMRAYDTREGWERWHDVHLQRFAEMRESLTVLEVWPDREMARPEPYREMADFLGLPYRVGDVRGQIRPALWHAGG